MTGSASSDQSTDPAAPSGPVTGGSGQTTLVTANLVEAVNLALDHALAGDPDVLVLGEDVGKKGGVYNVTSQLVQQFGINRVLNTLLDEQSILGLAIGLAQQGFLPIPEIQFLAYVHNAEDQIRAEAATLPFFSNGQ